LKNGEYIMKKKYKKKVSVTFMKLTPFQWKVLKAVQKIPLGETRTYRWVAEQIGSPGAVRAVGTALRKNPFPLIIPCHRVVKSDGELGKYAGRDDGRKKALLEMERRITEGFKSDVNMSQSHKVTGSHEEDFL